MKKPSLFIALMATSILTTEVWATQKSSYSDNDDNNNSRPASSRQRGTGNNNNNQEPSSSQNNTQQDDDDQKVMRLQNDIQEIERIMNEGLVHLSLNPDTQSLVILGNTGVGKSTIMHHLAGKPLYATKKFGSWALDTKFPLPNSKIGHSPNSETKLPGVFYDVQSNIVFWDCPGLNDTGTKTTSKGEEDIKNAFSIQKSFERPSKTKILLTISEADFKERRLTTIPDLLEKLVTMFPDINQLKNGLFLAITQGDSGFHEHTLRPMQLENFLERVKAEPLAIFTTKPATKQIYDFLFHAETIQERGFYYYNPHQEGEYNLDRQPILNKIKRTGPVQDIEFKKDVGPEAKNLAVKLAKKTNESLTDYIKTEGARQVVNHCHTLIDSWNDSVDVLRTKLTEVKEKLSSLVNKTAEQFAETLRPFFNIGKIRSSISQLTFLKDLNETVTHSVNDWAAAFTETIKQLEELAKAPDVFYNVEKKVLSVKGTLVGASDVNKALGAYQNPTQIDVNSLNTLWIDQDMKKHGISFSLIAPQWKVIGTRKIDISGKSGDHFLTPAPTGVDGQPGKPGGNGGHFYGKGISFNNLENLIVNTNGGKGGNGQKGADGVPGVNGEDGNPNKVTSESAGCTPYVDEAYETYALSYYNAQGTDGTPGQNGTKGGIGGVGGYSGNLIFKGIQWNNNDHTQNGESGKPGESGKGGPGGVHGRHHHGKLAHTGIRYQLKVIDRDWLGIADRALIPFGSYEGKEIALGWNPAKGYDTRVPATAAPGATPAVNDLNVTGRQEPAEQVDLNKDVKDNNYSTFYFNSASDSLVSPFIKIFPNLPAPFVKIFPGLPEVISERLHAQAAADSIMESEESQYVTLVSEAIEEADAIQSSIRETAIEIEIPLEMETLEEVDAVQSIPSETAIEDEENQYMALALETIEEADAIQSSIRETAIEIGVPLEMGTTLSSPSAH